MDKYLVFIDAADDAAMFPASNLQSATVAADGTMVLKFAPGSLGTGQAASIDTVTLTITADSEKAVFASLADAMSAPMRESSIVIADDVNGVYADDNITACAITLHA